MSCGDVITQYTTYQLVEECEWHHVRFVAHIKLQTWCTLLEKAMLYIPHAIFLEVMSRVW